jgi:pyrroloquinoline quinone (PQQ) biosynthesis protein C
MHDLIRSAWEQSVLSLQSGSFFKRMLEGSMTLTHYKALLRETYYNTKENPESFALMAGHLKGKKRNISKKIFRHCTAEYGHHEMALDDLRNLGVDTSLIPSQRPLPTTEAMLAFAIYHIQHRNPLTYLGYVYHLETLPSTSGHGIIDSLTRMGVPKNAMSFITEHAHADVGHTKWLEEYFEEAIENEEDLDAVIHGVKGTCTLHAVMLQGILDSVEESEKIIPELFGSAQHE